METKICSQCKGEPKPISEFYKRKASPDGYRPTCKTCKLENDLKYLHTKTGLITQIYGSQRKHSKKRGHPMPDYTKQQLTEWLLSQSLFHKLFNEWAKSGYDRLLIPSCDRKKNALPYTLGNIKLMTWKQNDDNGKIDMRYGGLLTGKPRRAVICINISTKERKEFVTVMEAERQTGTPHQNISRCCQDKIQTAGGYYWMYK